MVIIALAVNVPLTWGFAAVARMKASNPAPAVLAPVPPRTSHIWLLPPPSSNSPGVYEAVPYSMLVVVPQAIDTQSVHAPDLSQFKMPCLNPSTTLEKR